MKTLTIRQQRFVALYQGNATEAAIQAGYSAKTARSIGQRLLTNVDIQEAIQTREKKAMRTHIADREQRQEFWTAAMQDTEQAMRDRLKASELLGRSAGDFLERHDLTNSDGSMTPKATVQIYRIPDNGRD
jgi:phage terminase small subunit